jgi:hypothetical protein
VASAVLPLATGRLSQGAGTLIGGTGGIVVSSAGAGAGAGLAASSSAGIAAGAATGAETFGIGAVVGIALSLLAQHTARVKGATNENGAAAQIVQPFDSDIQEIVAAFNAGQVSASDALTAFAKVDAQVLAYLQAHVGAAGTQWNAAPKACDRSCTVGCCLYYFDLHPAILKLVQAIQSGTAQTVKVPQIFASKYGLAARPSYLLNVSPPGVAGNAGVAVQNALTSVGIPPTIGGVSTGTLVLIGAGLLLLRKLL